MAQPRDHQKRLIAAAKDLARALNRFVGLAGEALGSGQQSGSDGRHPVAVSTVRHAETTVKSIRLRSAIRAHWAAMTPKARASRIRKMHAWRRKK